MSEIRESENRESGNQECLLLEETKNSVSLRHRREWEFFRVHTLRPIMENWDEAGAKFAKALADVLKIYQEGERKAWGFSEGEAPAQAEIRWEE